MDQDAQDANLIVGLSEEFGKDEAWKLAAAEAFSKATPVERAVARCGTRAEQLKVVDALILKTSAAGLGAGSASGAGTAAGGGPSITGAGGTDMATMLQFAREAALAVMEAQTAPRRPRSFSTVSSTEVDQLLGDLSLFEVDGNDVFTEELHVPGDTAACISFDFSGYSNDEEATVPLLKHHQKQLERLGVPFGRGGFQIYDVHSLKQDSLLIRHGKTAFRGIFGGCVAPYGLSQASSLRQCRIVYEHNMPQVQQARNAHKGQTILKLLAAYAYGPCPVLLYLTDGMQHTVYTIRGQQLIVWATLTPTQAYHLQARHLLAHSTRTDRVLTLERIQEEEQAWMRPLHQLRPASALHEQLESVVPFLPPDERVPAALELIHAWAQAQPEQMQLPAGIQAFYT